MSERFPTLSGQVRVRVPAKVNVGLFVGPTRPDGYHELGTVFQALSLYDDITVAALPDGQIRVNTWGEGAASLPTDDRNLAVRAAKALRDHHGTADLGVQIMINKSIPVAGGMAGGSADAAGTLVACAKLWELDVSPGDLTPLAASLGADVPFPLLGGTALGLGRGDELTPLSTRGQYHWVLALAHRGLSTPDVFRRFDELNAVSGEVAAIRVCDDLLGALSSGDQTLLGRHLHNDLEAAALSLRPELEITLTTGRSSGALGGVLAGSGPTCAFLCDTDASAAGLADRLAELSTVRSVRRATGPVAGARLFS